MKTDTNPGSAAVAVDPGDTFSDISNADLNALCSAARENLLPPTGGSRRVIDPYGRPTDDWNVAVRGGTRVMLGVRNNGNQELYQKEYNTLRYLCRLWKAMQNGADNAATATPAAQTAPATDTTNYDKARAERAARNTKATRATL